MACLLTLIAPTDRQMSPNIGWQDLKDLFRAAGTVMRADINVDHTTGISKGTGVVVMENKSQADAAICTFSR